MPATTTATNTVTNNSSRIRNAGGYFLSGIANLARGVGGAVRNVATAAVPSSNIIRALTFLGIATRSAAAEDSIAGMDKALFAAIIVGSVLTAGVITAACVTHNSGCHRCNRLCCCCNNRPERHFDANHLRDVIDTEAASTTPDSHVSYSVTLG